MTSLVHNARKARIEKIDSSLAGVFVEENHRQGLAKPGKRLRSYGLFIEDELLAVAMFCNPRTAGMQRSYTTELFRLAFKKGHRVRGGASKLIKYFLNDAKPWDLFTYQDTAGEATAVYEHAGMKLLGVKDPKKRVLVKNGLTRDTARDNRSDWLSLEQVSRFGPDALLGTKLGQVYEEVAGKIIRVSNVRLFTEYLDYHLEEIPGDRIYEWRNPQITHYVYKITSSADDGYYIGRRAIPVAGATEIDCMKDSYSGSGGEKFKNWVNSVGKETLQKEVLGIYDSWEKVLKAEAREIGEKYETDHNCKNTFPGGFWSGFVIGGGTVREFECSSHGLSKHYGKTCMKCMSQSNVHELYCEVHGYGKHIGDKCSRCIAGVSRTQKICASHGATNFMGDTCLKCMQGKINALGRCPIHGITPMKGSTCIKCSRLKAMTVKNCSVHGESKHQGNTCIKCSRAKATQEKLCEVHGISKHQGDSCIKCSRARATTVKECSIHGESKHQGDRCIKCSRVKKQVS